MKRKVGLSPVIASMMMIMLVLILAVMIFLWARGFISEQIQKFDNPIEDACKAVNFDVVLDGDDLEIINRGNIGIRSFDIKLVKGGDAEVANFDFDLQQLDPGKAIRKEVGLLMKDGFSVPDKIVVSPVLLGSVKGETKNKIFTCTDAGKTL